MATASRTNATTGRWPRRAGGRRRHAPASTSRDRGPWISTRYPSPGAAAASATTAARSSNPSRSIRPSAARAPTRAKGTSRRSCGRSRRIGSRGRRAAPGCGPTLPTTGAAPLRPASRIDSASRCAPKPTPTRRARCWSEAKGPSPTSQATSSARIPSRSSPPTARANRPSAPSASLPARGSITWPSTRAR